MKKRLVCAVLALSFCSFGFGQLIQTTNPSLFYMLDEPRNPLVVFTFDSVESKELAKDGPPPVQVQGSLLIYLDGTTLLNIMPTSSSEDVDISGRITQVSLRKPAGNDEGDIADLKDPINFDLYMDGASFGPYDWQLASPPEPNNQLNPDGMLDAPKEDYLGFWSSNNDASKHAQNNSVMSFLFWLDFDFMDQFSALEVLEQFYGSTPEGKGDLIFKWQGLRPLDALLDGEDSYTAIAQLKPFFGDVIAVPEPSTYAAGAFLLIFAAGHFFVRRRQRRAAEATAQ